MTTPTDITKIREWADEPNDPNDPDAWPAPTEYVEFLIEGQMRTDVLARIGRSDDTDAVVRMIHADIEGGWSEFTVEMDYCIEVWVDEGRQSQRVFDSEASSEDGRLPALLAWLEAGR